MNQYRKFWAVWRLNGGGAPTKRHESLSDAQAEANRLCQQSNEPYYVLEVCGIVKPVSLPVAWEEIR